MKHARSHRIPAFAHLCVGAAALALTAACANGQPQANAPAPTATLRGLIGDAACDSDAQCRTVPIGAKACGGPEAYLAWSLARTDAGALQAEAARHAKASRLEAAAKGMASNCAVVVDPGAYCAPAETGASTASAGPARVCRLRSSRSGAGKPIY